jgi:hypothetical protein
MKRSDNGSRRWWTSLTHYLDYSTSVLPLMKANSILVDALRRISESPISGPEKSAIAWSALKRAEKKDG